jgi:isoleucyl-tRNA synthetase
VHTSVFVKLPIIERPGEYILIWTTTPWTLAANTALAVNPELDYARVKQDWDVLYLSVGTLDRLKSGYELLGTVKGSELVGLHYQGPFSDLPAQEGLETRVVAWSDVGEDEGTGVVHIAPGCGAEDFELSREHNLPVLVPIDESGVYYPNYGWLAGKQVSEVAQLIFDDLARKGLLYKTEEYLHRYPVCWRCQEELVFRLVDEWFISCHQLREPMIEEARKVKWVPDYAGKRMEDWLNNMGDWCISRKRFWGLPLPFFKCSCGETIVVGSRKELEELAVSGMETLPELHRPWIDEVRLKCPKCGGVALRVTEVGDCWLDAGIVAFSTLGYLDEDNSYWQKWFPADFVVEMREQIRLWFYTMLFMSVTLTGEAPYRSALVYEKVHDEQGRPMHKSWGNAIWFDDAVDKMGADVMRWVYAGANIQTNLNFGFGVGSEAVRKLLTLWNVYSFFVMYARLDKWQGSWDMGHGAWEADHESRPEIDRWVLSRLNSLVTDVTVSLETYEVARVTQLVEEFVDDLSNWYVRLSRRRFWKSQEDEDKESAYSTLYEALVTLARLLAPIMPFTTEKIYQNLVRSVDESVPESVHLCDWPVADQSLVDRRLMDETESVMKVVRLGRSARNAAGIKVRQPLPMVFMKPSSLTEQEAVKRNELLILDELNVKALSFVQAEMPEGLQIVEEAGTVVALDTALTEELVREGLVRDLIRRIQNMRKEMHFKVDDHILIHYHASGRLLEAIQAFEDYIKQETLADVLEASDAVDGQTVKIGPEQLEIRLGKA